MAIQTDLSGRVLRSAWVIPALVLLIAAAGVTVAFTTTLSSRAEHQKRINRLKNDIRKREELMKENEAVDRVIKSISVTDREENRLSPTLSFLITAADISGASLGKIEFGEWRPKEKYDEAEVQFTVLGSYDHIGRFVNYLERKKPAILMQGLKVARAENALKATIKGSIFVLK